MSAKSRNKRQARLAERTSLTAELSPTISGGDTGRLPDALRVTPRKTKGQAHAATPVDVQPAGPAEKPAAHARKPSIRSLITSMLAEGKTTADIAVAVQAQFPSSQAAAKSTKHISFYRCLANKERRLASQATAE